MNVINAGLGYATPTPFAAKITRQGTAPAPTRITAGTGPHPAYPITTSAHRYAANLAGRTTSARLITQAETVQYQRKGYASIATGTGTDDTQTTGQLWPRTA